MHKWVLRIPMIQAMKLTWPKKGFNSFSESQKMEACIELPHYDMCVCVCLESLYKKHIKL